MPSFKILFYRSEGGELVKVREFYRVANALSDLVQTPPKEFFDMLEDSLPMHGWAEVDEGRVTVFLIFVPRPGDLGEVDHDEFVDWLRNIKPSDLSGTA